MLSREILIQIKPRHARPATPGVHSACILLATIPGAPQDAHPDWQDGAAQGPEVAPAAVVRHVRRNPEEAEAGSNSEWAPDLLHALALTHHRALRALPAAAPNLLATVNALAAVSPTAVTVRRGSCLPHDTECL